MSEAQSTPANVHAGSASRRRLRYTITTLVLFTAISAACLIAIVLGARHSVRYDLTATREHTLSPRTQGMLSRLDLPIQIVISADLGRLDRRSRQRVDDVLAAFAQSSEQVTITTIDTSAATSVSQYQQLIENLADADAAQILEHRQVLDALRSGLESLGAGLTSVEILLTTIEESLPPTDGRRSELRQLAASARFLMREFDRAGELTRTAAQHTVGAVNLPQTDQVQSEVGTILSDASRVLAIASAQATKFVQEARAGESTADATASARLSQSATQLRDQAALLADQLARLAPLEPLMVARALAERETVLIISPDKVTAVDFQALFPASELVDATGQAQLLFAGEQLLATAVGALASDRQPIVVFVHGEPVRMFDTRGLLVPAAEPRFGNLVRQLRLRQIDVIDWATGVDDARPDLGRFDPEGRRPVIWFMIGKPARTATTARGTDAADRARRLGLLSDALTDLIESGENLLVTVDPSELPAIGQDDPLAEPLGIMGLDVDSGRPLIRRQSSPLGNVIFAVQTTAAASADHAIGMAIDGLNLVLPWASDIALAERKGVAAWPIISIADNDDIWGEAQWLEVSVRTRGNILEGLLMQQPPDRNEQRDNLNGPWTIAAAAERPKDQSLPEGAGSAMQRLVAVASSYWADDALTQLTRTVDGRSVRVFPGNTELFEAAVYWLAGQDELIAPSPQAREIPRIRPMTPGQVIAVRWGFILGLPVLVLLMGAAWRLLRS